LHNVTVLEHIKEGSKVFERCVMSPGTRTIVLMNTIVNRFVEAHDRYMELDRMRTECTNPAERESVHIAILRAYLEVQFHARQIAGLQFAEGMDFAEVN
jgi:hypothetical protein